MRSFWLFSLRLSIMNDTRNRDASYKITVFVYILWALGNCLSSTSASTSDDDSPLSSLVYYTFAAIIEPLLPPRSIAALQ